MSVRIEASGERVIVVGAKTGPIGRIGTCRPLLAEILRRRGISLLIVGVGFTQLLSAWAGLRLWTCPWRAVTATPCPGCGLSRACLALAAGDWRRGWVLHPFAPVLLGFLALVCLASLLPESPRQSLARQVARFESRTCLVPGLLVALAIFGTARLVLGIDPFNLAGPPS